MCRIKRLKEYILYIINIKHFRIHTLYIYIYILCVWVFVCNFNFDVGQSVQQVRTQQISTRKSAWCKTYLHSLALESKVRCPTPHMDKEKTKRKM